MQPAPRPPNETDRLVALRELRVLDTPPEPSFDQIAQLARRLTAAPVSFVSLVDDRRIFFKSKVGLEKAGLVLGEPNRDHWFCSYVVASGAPLVVEDAAVDERFADLSIVQAEPGARFYMGVPLRSPGGVIVGALAVVDVVARKGTDAELSALRELSKLTEGELSSLQNATTDSLTGVAHKRMFERIGNHLLGFSDAQRQPSVVLRADYNGLGMVNQLYGYDVGDRALADAAAVFRETVRGSDLVARVGPDEFGALLIGAGEESVPNVLSRLGDHLRARNESDHRPYVVSFDYGYFEHRLGDGMDIAALLRSAELQRNECRRRPGRV